MCTCDACGKGYSGKKALEKHINVHTGDDVEVDEDDTGSSSSSDSSGEDDTVNQLLFACEKFLRGLGEPHCGEYFASDQYLPYSCNGKNGCG